MSGDLDALQNLDLSTLSEEQLEDLYFSLSGYDEKPVSIEEFIMSDYYLFNYFKNDGFREYWMNVLKDIYPEPGKSDKYLIILRGCLSPTTLISLYNGNPDTIENLYIRFHNGESLSTISMDKEFNLVQDKITNVFTTGVKKIYSILLDNGNTVECTSNHQFLSVYGDWISIDDKLAPGSALISSCGDSRRAIIVERIDELGDSLVYDITTENFHNFSIEAGIIAHNSIGRGKCLSGDTEVTLDNDLPIRITDIDKNSDIYVKSFNLDTKRFESNKVLDVVSNGVRELYRVHLSNGKHIDCTSNHKFLAKSRNLYDVNYWVTIDNGLRINTVLTGYSNDKISSIYVTDISYLGHKDSYDLTVENNHNFVLSSGVVSHNSTAAIIGMMYDIYCLQCLSNPQYQFRLVDKERIVFAFLNATQSLGDTVLMGKVDGMISSSPYFSGIVDKAITTKSKTKFPKEVDIFSGSRITSTLGKAIYCALVSEVAFGVIKNQMLDIFDSIIARQASRFMVDGEVAGRTWIDSSEKDTSSELNIIADRYTGKPGVYVDTGPLWEVKPNDYINGKFFYLYTGSDKQQPCIIDTNKDFMVSLVSAEPHNIVSVPEVHRITFEANIDRAIRDLLGRPTKSKFRLFRDISKVVSSLKFTSLWEDVISIDFDDKEDLIQSKCKIPGYFKSILYPDNPRAIHLDMSVSGDKFGIASGFISGHKEVVTDVDPETMEYSKTSMPKVVIEFAFSIQAKPGQQIPYYKVRLFVDWLQRLGYPIARISADGFQCLHPDTLIETNNGSKKISDLSTNGEISVFSMDQNGEIVKSCGKCTITGHTSRFLNITLDHGEVLMCTENHRILTDVNSYTLSSDLSVGDTILTKHGKRVVDSKSIKDLKDPIPVYDIEVPYYHNYVLSSGIIVHNSVDMLQSFKRMGIETEVISMDRDPNNYFSFAVATNEGRVVAPDNSLLKLELEHLEVSPDQKRVDHPDTFTNGDVGSKDCSDACCGVYISSLRIRDKYGSMISSPTVIYEEEKKSPLMSAISDLWDPHTSPNYDTIEEDLMREEEEIATKNLIIKKSLEEYLVRKG